MALIESLYPILYEWSIVIITIIIISHTTSKTRRNMGRPLQGCGAIAVQLSLPLSVKYISIAM